MAGLPPPPSLSRRRSRWAWVALLLLAFGLRVAHLDGREFWFDEALSATISAMGWKSTLSYVQDMPFEHPPFYYLALYPWQVWTGSSEFALRFFSVFWGVLFIPLFYRLVWRLSDRRLGYLAAILATLAPFMVAYSREARMYTLLPCLAVGVLYTFLRAIDGHEQPGWWLLHGGLLIAGIATHYLFAGLWLALLVYLFLEGAQRRWIVWGFLIQAIVLAAVLVWGYAAPGLRASLLRLAQGEAAFGLAYKLNKIVSTLILGEIPGAETPVLAILLAVGGWVLALMGAWYAWREGLSSLAWRFVLLVLVVPLLGSLVVPYGVLGRHLGYTLIALFIFMALALRALARRGRFPLAMGVLVVLSFSGYGLSRHYSDRGGDLRQAMAYLRDRVEPGDLILIPQPDQRHLMDYYNRDAWPIRYLPEPDTPLTAAGVKETLQEIMGRHSRVWLGPIGAWTADPELLVEQWLASHAFQAEKVWFPASSSVALYFGGSPELIPIRLGPLTWGGRIRLQRLQAGPMEVTAGDAIRLRFVWRAGLDVEERYAVIVELVDEDGQVWARRRTEPCGGWCPTDGWMQGQRREDAHALLIPVGTPPGAYQVQVRWELVSGGPTLPVEGGSASGDRVTIVEATVLPAPPGQKEVRAMPHPLQATFGGEISLVGYDLTPAEARPGETLRVETHWRAETGPDEEYALRLELVNGSGQVVMTWQGPLATRLYPTDAWQPGEYVRGQHSVSLPQDVAPGRYQVRLSVITPAGDRLTVHGERPRCWLGGLVQGKEELTGDRLALTTVQVRDRDRQFRRPAIAVPLRAIVGKRAYLLGYELDQSQAYPGGQLSLTLYWQAGGPMTRPFKVFTHLVDEEGVIRAQHDGPPGEGCCPTHTWVEGEIIVDPHQILLGADLKAGPYQLVIGMYEEETGQRLRALTPAGQLFPNSQVPLGGVHIRPLSVPGGPLAGPQFDYPYHNLLPMIDKGMTGR